MAVELDLHAGDQEMNFPAEQITLEVGGETFSPYGALLADESLAAGERASAASSSSRCRRHRNGHVPAEWRRTVGQVDVSKGPGGRPVTTHDHE